MTILAMEMRGLGLTPEETAAVVRVAQQQQIRPFLTFMPTATATATMDAGANASTLLATWGPRVGAGLAGLAVGLVLAKMARRRKKG
jgi:hypothetical protein